ncbi:GNAT family N-acetyltransferase [Flavobacterium frigidarium]|uniref:GNAT family N-acetyltransferase n=1 Tax=Flavobacterium frigidarium TaxID=99286 RepID=UPI0030DA7C10|tara:strand:- start:8206 stop:8727 length:522 start_codon:yes stop_codon:yes gene_type:complete
MELNHYNIKLRLVEIADADFIIKLRTDSSKSRFISKTDSNVQEQENWIAKYKERELIGEEYYFIAIDENDVKFATYRLYNKTIKSIEIGSFVSKPRYDKPLNVIKVDIILKAFVFKNLGYDELTFEVRKDNKSVINYHKKFNPTIIREDEQNFYFILERESFFKNKDKFEKLF